jgi:hypothetical protein
MPRIHTPFLLVVATAVITIGGSTGTALAQAENLLVNGSFASGLEGWTVTGDVALASTGWDDSGHVRLRPATGQTAELAQVVSDLEPRARYTVAARIRTSDRLSPPILGIRNGVQIAKAHGWVAIDDEGRWLERRFEVHVDEGATSLEVYLQAWQTDSKVTVDFDAIRLWKDRQAPPSADPDDEPWSEAPVIDVAPNSGDSLLKNPHFDAPDGGAWALGINASVTEVDSQPALRLLSGPDTSRASQVVVPALPPGGRWTLSMEVKVDPDVVASAYLAATGGFLASRSFSNTEWETIEIPIESGEEWLRHGKLTLENWKNQPGAAWYRNLSFEASGDEWVPTLASPPQARPEVFFDDFSSGMLDPADWLVSGKAWGGDNGGVAPENVTLVEDLDEGETIVALRLEAHGDL